LEVGLQFVQFNKNISHHSGINRTPYKAMFGSDAKMGLTSSPLPQEMLSTLSTGLSDSAACDLSIEMSFREIGCAMTS
jgi:hypothetical protein